MTKEEKKALKQAEKSAMTRGDKISDAIHNIIFILVGILLIYVVLNFFLAKDRSEVFYLGYKPAVVVSGSMEPRIMQDGLILVKHESFDNIKVGDIVVFKFGDAMVSHQVISKDASNIQTKGINNNSPDPFSVTPDMVLGKVVFIFNAFGWIILSFKKPLNIVLWVVCIVAIIAFIILLKSLRRKNKEENKESENDITTE